MNQFKKVCSVLLAFVMLLPVVPMAVFAVDEAPQMSEEFRSYLQDGKLVLNFAKPNSKDDWYADLVCSFYEDAQFADGEPPHSLYLHDDNGMPAFSDDLSKITVSLSMFGREEEKHTVDVVWNYDEDVLEKAQAILQKIPANSTFGLTDLEFFNYLAHVSPEYSWEVSMLDYSGELKAITENTNFIFKMDVRKGGGSAFHGHTGGIVRMIYGDTTYCISTELIMAGSDYVIYVPESTPDDRTSILKAAQKRVDDYIGKDKITITDNGETVLQYYQNEIDNFNLQIPDLQQELIEIKSLLDAEQAKDPAMQDLNLISELSTQIFWKEFDLSRLENDRDYAIEEYETVRQLDHVKNAVGDYVFSVSVNGREEEYRFVVNKDDSKLADPTYESADVKTDVSASTDSSEVPLDTVIKVEKITHGEEHERICGTLEIKDGEIFDIKLHSGSLDDYITELKNGKFKVRLPIKNEYKGKELVVYYVDADGNKTKFDVTIKNNFAFFETSHFSVYTLTTAEGDPTAPEGELTNEDLAVLVRYLAGWSVTAPVVDLTGDGRITNRDAVYLIQKLAGWFD